jgi:hypothetical protein
MWEYKTTFTSMFMSAVTNLPICMNGRVLRNHSGPELACNKGDTEERHLWVFSDVSPDGGPTSLLITLST